MLYIQRILLVWWYALQPIWPQKISIGPILNQKHVFGVRGWVIISLPLLFRCTKPDVIGSMWLIVVDIWSPNWSKGWHRGLCQTNLRRFLIYYRDIDIEQKHNKLIQKWVIYDLECCMVYLRCQSFCCDVNHCLDEHCNQSVIKSFAETTVPPVGLSQFVSASVIQYGFGKDCRSTLSLSPYT